MTTCRRSHRTSGTSAAASWCAASCPRPTGARSGRSCSSTTSARSTSHPGAQPRRAARIRTSAWRRVTYPFEGAMMHRDSTGVVQRIEPGAVNWMSAGRGIVHSERTPKDLLGRAHRSHGLQLWVALPEARRGRGAVVPASRRRRASRRCGSTARRCTSSPARRSAPTSPIATASPTLALVFDFDVASGQGRSCSPASRPSARSTRVDHPFEIDGEAYRRAHDGRARAAARRRSWRRRAAAASSLVGGESLGHRFISWNFVSSRRERILAAEDDWRGAALRQHPGRDRVHPAADAPPRRAAGAASAGRQHQRVAGRPASARPQSGQQRRDESLRASERDDEREQRRHHADGAGRPGADAVLQRQEAGEGQHRAGQREPGERQPPARRGRPARGRGRGRAPTIAARRRAP